MLAGEYYVNIWFNMLAGEDYVSIWLNMLAGKIILTCGLIC